MSLEVHGDSISDPSIADIELEEVNLQIAEEKDLEKAQQENYNNHRLGSSNLVAKQKDEIAEAIGQVSQGKQEPTVSCVQTDFSKIIEDIEKMEPKKPANINLGLKVLQTGTKKFDQIDTNLRRVADLVKKDEETISLLLNLKKNLNALPHDAKMHELSEDIIDLIGQLQDLDVDLLKLEEENKTISKEQLIELKAQADSFTSKIRTHEQSLFTEMTTTLTDRAALLETLKATIKSYSRLIESIVEKTGRQS